MGKTSEVSMGGIMIQTSCIEISIEITETMFKVKRAIRENRISEEKGLDEDGVSV